LGLGARESQAQVLMNTGFESVSIFGATYFVGWDTFNGARRRTVGDGLTPALASAHCGTAVAELGPAAPPIPDTATNFIGVSSNLRIDPLDGSSPKNNFGYTFDPQLGPTDLEYGPDLTLSGWFMIPADDPLVGQRAGLKLEFRRTVNDSAYEAFDYFFVDPADPTTMPGLVGVTTPTGAGVHTNGQWLYWQGVFHQNQFCWDTMLNMLCWEFPPQNPDAKVSLMCIRFGVRYSEGSRGTVYFDDVDLFQGAPCAADFNRSGMVSVQDIFDFLAAYFTSDSRADVNDSCTVTVQDIFDYLALYFTGC
jgi:hypothetical protein